LIKPIPFTMSPGSDGDMRLRAFLRKKTVALREGLSQLHGLNGVVRWRKIYEAKPAEEIREWPWHNASNLVTPIAAIHSDTLLARVMAAVFKTRPLWVSRLMGDFSNEAPPGLKDSLEEFLQWAALEKEELDLYRVERDWFSDTIKLGTGVLKTPWTKSVIDQAISSGDGSAKPDFVSKTLYDGPRPEKVRYEDFKYPVSVPTVDAMDFKYHIVRLQREELEERSFKGIYDKMATKIVLGSPDRTSPDVVQAQKEMDAKAVTASGYGWAEWDLYECHYKYRDGSRYVKLITTYHEKTNQILRSYYYYYPGEVFTVARLFYRDDMFPGMGMAEVMLPIQEELSQIHNGRRDNSTIANMKMWRVDPDSPLNKGYRIYPGAMLPGKEGEIEALEFGTPVAGEIDSERMTLEYADKRSGVSAPMQGAGSGTQTKRGIYTAMGTLSVMQEGNTRTDLNITDIRYAHTQLGNLLCSLFAEFGLGERKALFGQKGALIEQALDAMRDRKITLPVYASTASINREVEKQNDLMLAGVSERYHQSITQMLTAAANPMVPEEVRNYITKAILSQNIFMQAVYRHFGYDEVDTLAPKPEVKPPQQAAPQPSAQPQAAQGQLQGLPPGGTLPMMTPPAAQSGRVM